MSEESVAIFHYHLQPGGVTTVIGLSVRAIVQHFPGLRHIDLVSGEKAGADVLPRIQEQLPPHAPTVVSHVLPEIGYLPEEDAEALDPDTLADRLLDLFGGSIWWIHNYHLGKNPVFTEVLLRIAHRHDEQRMIFHIHDFPECARYGNLRYLNRILSLPPYPIAPNVRYALINSRDLNLLIGAGVPEAHAFLLVNPIDSHPLDRSHAKRTREQLSRHFSSEFPLFDPLATTLLYPVRTIRRKNVLEAAIIARVAPQPTNLIVTLPGVSAREAPYSHTIEGLYREKVIQGLWGIGRSIDRVGISFLDLAASADLVISTSVQEGFGFLFVDALLWGLPLLARYLDVTDGMKDTLGCDSVHLYPSFQVPLEPARREELRRLYTDRTRTLDGFIDSGSLSQLQQSLGRIFSETSIDFSFLDVSSQIDVLNRATSSKEAVGEIREMNSSLFHHFDRLQHMGTAIEPMEIPERFTFSGFAATVRELIDSFGAGARMDSSHVQPRLVRAFSQPEYIRLLYE